MKSRLLPASILLIAVLGLIVPATAQNGPGDLNPGFNTGEFLATGAPATIHAMVTESDGDVIVAGDFTTIGGVARGSIAKIKADGTLDPSFATGAGANGPIHCVAVRSNGQILIGGDFTSFNGTARNRIARLTSGGSLDTTFNPGTGADATVRAVVEFDGATWIGGDFMSVNNQTRQRLAFLNSNGSVGSSLYNCNGPVHAMAVREGIFDSALIIGGDFTTVGALPRPYLAQIDSYGYVDGPLTEGSGPNGPVFALATERDPSSTFDDSGLLVGGSFTMVDGKTHGGLARIAIDYFNGARLDPFFSVWTGGSVRALHLLYATSYDPPSGLLLGGEFSSINGLPRNRIARLALTQVSDSGNSSESGTLAVLDPTYAAGGGADAAVKAIAVSSNGRVYACGAFAQMSGTPRTALARLYGEFGSALPGIPGAPAAKALCSDKIYVSWSSSSNTATYVVERSPNGVDQWASAGSGASYYVDSGRTLGMEYFYRIKGSNDNGLGTASTVVSATTDAFIWQGPGSLDPAVAGMSASSTVYAVARQPDGKILIAGSFGTVGGVTCNDIARLNEDWTLDTSFDPGSGTSGSIYALALAPDGKIVIAGSFSTFNGTGRVNVARLNADGSLDAGLNPGTGPNSSVYSVAIQGDGRVLIGGTFSRVTGYSQPYLARLNADGSFEPSFRTSPTGTVYQIRNLADGRFLFAGSFTEVNGLSLRGIAKAHADGTLDTTFNPGSGAYPTYGLDVAADGKIMVSGSFTTVNGVARRYVARLEANGALDPGFDPGSSAASYVDQVAVDGDGRVIIGGSFTMVAGEPRFRIARLNSNGSLDNGFRIGSGLSSSVESLLVQPDGKVVVGGLFTSYDGVSVGRVLRLRGGVIEPLAITTSDPLPTATVNAAYSYPLVANGGVPAYAWSVVSGSLPDGLQLTANGTLTGTATAPGSALVTVRVTDAHANSAEMPFNITVLSGQSLDYAAWVSLHFTPTEAADPMISGQEIDADGDGLNNLLESAFGGNPKVADAAAQRPVLTVVDGHYEFTFFSDANRTDINCTVESSTDLTPLSWTRIATCVAGGMVNPVGEACSVEDTGSGLRQVTLTGLSPVSADPKMMFRVRVDAQ